MPDEAPHPKHEHNPLIFPDDFLWGTATSAHQVASQIDSRTIIDQPGAEKLLGAGDMLYSSGEMASPERIQCAYISEEEVKKVVNFIKDNNDILPDEINLSPGALGNTDGIFSSGVDDSGGDDDLYEDARTTVIESGKASTSYLQRKLGVGYARAAKLIDMLEERGVVGPGNGAKPREILERPVVEEASDFS
jgi:S-DNA-T family DNA segregation ATPase FtsK/SpoIIIE